MAVRIPRGKQVQDYMKLRDITREYKRLKLLLEAVRQTAEARQADQKETLLSPDYPKSGRVKGSHARR